MLWDTRQGCVDTQSNEQLFFLVEHMVFDLTLQQLCTVLVHSDSRGKMRQGIEDTF